MGLSTNTYTYSGGSKQFSATFADGYIEQSHVTAYVVGAVDGLGDQVYLNFTWTSESQITVTDDITVGDEVTVERTVPKDSVLVDLDENGAITREGLARNNRQALHAVHEVIDGRLDNSLITAVNDLVARVNAIDASVSEAANFASVASIAAATALAAANDAALVANSAATLLRNATVISDGSTIYNLEHDLPVGLVFLDGVQQNFGAYTQDQAGKTITFVENVPEGTSIEILYSAGSAAYSLQTFDSVSSMVSSTLLDYTNVEEGALLTTRTGGLVYQVMPASTLPSQATEVTAGGLRVKLMGSNGTIKVSAVSSKGDGTVDASEDFKRINGFDAGVVDLEGGTFLLTSSAIDPVNGTTLRKDYINGTLIMDGRPIVFEATASLAASAASTPTNVPTTRDVGLIKIDDNTFNVYRHLRGTVWSRYELTRSAAGTPFNWNETYLEQVVEYKAARDNGVVYTGTWTGASSTYNLKSGGTDYISGRAQQATVAGDYVEITFEGGKDLFVVFVGRTSGNHVNVTLNGGSDYLILPKEGGNSYFDSYTSTDLAKRQIVQIASGVPEGTHTVRLTLSAEKNPASSGGRFVFNAMSWASSNTGPWQPGVDALPWTDGETVLQNHERKHGDNYYYAVADGVSGSTPPTHTSGTVSDGSVSWAYKAASSYVGRTHRLQAAGSQLEYAYEIKPASATALEDVGGLMHGNETQTSYKWLVGASAVNPDAGQWLTGDAVSIVENIEATHSQVAGSVNDTTLRREFTRVGVEVSHEHKLNTAGEFGYFYAHMWPLLHYSSIGQKYGVLDMWSPSDGHRLCEDWYDQANPIIGRTKDTIMVASGECMQPDGSGGAPSTEDAPLRFKAWLSVSPQGVGFYKSANDVFAGKAMNTSAANVSTGGYSSMTSKMYFERYAASDRQTYSAGDTIKCRAFYGMSLEAK